MKVDCRFYVYGKKSVFKNDAKLPPLLKLLDPSVKLSSVKLVAELQTFAAQN